MKSIELFQWDLNKKIPCSFPEAHFACIGSKDALIVKANGGNVQIPNVILQEGKDIMFWFMRDGAVAESGKIRIITRAKPADYVYTESEIITFETLVAKVEDVIAKANAATDNATTAAQKAEEAALKADAASDKATQIEAEIKAAEVLRKTAEQGRAEAEATRAANETKRTETFNTNLGSWNTKVDAACKKATDTASKAAQDAKTATDAAIVKTEQATNAAVAKADKATASATTAANKAEAVVAQLPIPTGNVLKGEAESTFINLHDSWKAPIVKGKVLGQSNQITTTGKNLINGMESFCKASELPSNLRKYCWGYSLGQSPLKLEQPLKPGTYTYSLYCDSGATVYLSQSPYSGNNEQFVINNKLPNDTKNGLVRHYGTIQLTKESNIAGIYSDYSACCCGMLNEGTKPLPYEPYTGGKPSPSPEYPQEITNLNKAELVITGKNLLDESLLQENAGNTKAPIFLAKGTYVLSVQNDTEWWKTASNKQTVFVHTFDTNEFISSAVFINLTLGKRSYGRLTISKDCNIKIYSYGGWANKAVSKIQLEAGTEPTAYEPHKSKSTPIDLKGNELCSLPNGVKDEVVIDAEGNVSLIKRVAKKTYNGAPEEQWARNGETEELCRFYTMVEGKAFGTGAVTTNVVSDRFTKNSLTLNERVSSTMVEVGISKRIIPTLDAKLFKQWLTKNPTTFVYKLAEPQTIPLGKVELPALPEATSNVWNNGNIPANVYVQYLKDVNIAYSDLENQIKQITAALSVIDTPTVIPEMAWGTPAAI